MSQYQLPKLADANGDITKRWFVFYNFKNPDSSKLERFRIFISSKLKTKAARYKKASEIIDLYTNKLISGWNPFEANAKRNMPLFEALDIVYEFKSNSLRPRSVNSYSSIIHIFKNYLKQHSLTGMLLSAFDFYKANDFMDYCMNVRKIGPRTYNNYRAYMISIFNDLINRKYISVNPFEGIDKLEEHQPQVIAYSESELKIIKEKLPEYNPELFLVAMLIFYAFIRPQEIVRLKIWQIDIKRKEIHLTGDMTKNKKQKTIGMPDPLAEILSEWHFNGNPNMYIYSKNQQPGKLQIAPTRIAERWRKLCNQFDLPDWKGIYDLKHTSVGMCIDAGINVRDLQLHLRHSSLEVTQKYLEQFRNITSDSLIKNFPRF